MLLTIDIGNTNIVLGVFRGEDLVAEFRLKTDLLRTVDEYCALMLPLVERKLGKDVKWSGAVVSSVVPPLTDGIVQAVKQAFSLDCLVVGPGTKTGIAIRVDDPRAVGADRIVNSVAVKVLHGTPALVVDFGTATTIDYVSAEGNYEGGVIAPGLLLSLEALVRNTARLPRIELQWPASVIGKGTVSAMQSGTMVGYVCMVEGLIERIQRETGKIEHLVATGGLGGMLVQHSAVVREYDPYLTLKGLRIIYGMNR